MAGFIDKVVTGINKGVTSVSEGSKIFVEKAKLNTLIQDTEKEKNQLLLNMGNLVYNLHNNGEIHIEQCMGLCDSIGQLNQKIIDLQNQLQVMDSSVQQNYNIPNIKIKVCFGILTHN